MATSNATSEKIPGETHLVRIWGGGKSKRTNPAAVAAASTAFICIPINRRIEGEEQGGDTMLSPHNHESNRGSWRRTHRYMLIMKSVGG